MIRKLVLIRHGDAENRRLGQADAERRLTISGLRALQKGYPALLEPLKDEVTDIHVWSSEAVRARETAEVACDVLGIPRDQIEFHKSLFAQDYDYFYNELLSADGVIVAVGHIPFMEEIAADLANRMISFPKGSIACFEIPGGSLVHARLLWFARGPEVG